MANPTCTSASLAETTPQFSSLSDRQYWAAWIYLNILELAANGGTDYRSVLTTTLITDANTLVGRMDVGQMKRSALQVQWNNAASAGASMPASVDALNALTSCCVQAENANFEAILLLLACKLGRHADYPQ